MADLLVLCPTRGRPDAARATYASFLATRVNPNTDMKFVIDYDDPNDYIGLPCLILDVDQTGNMVKALNSAAQIVLQDEAPTYLGFVGDDHRFRTAGWDAVVIAELERLGGGLVYCDDLAQRAQLPTQVFISSVIVKALGWMGLPTCQHLYIDNAWLVIGRGIDRIKFLPDVIVEHLHPAYGKGEWDEGHVRVNSAEMYANDGAAFGRWLHDGATADIEKARSVL